MAHQTDKSRNCELHNSSWAAKARTTILSVLRRTHSSHLQREMGVVHPAIRPPIRLQHWTAQSSHMIQDPCNESITTSPESLEFHCTLLPTPFLPLYTSSSPAACNQKIGFSLPAISADSRKNAAEIHRKPWGFQHLPQVRGGSRESPVYLRADR